MLIAIPIIFLHRAFPYALNIAIAIISVSCLYEYVVATKVKQNPLFLVPSFCVAGITPFIPVLNANSFAIYVIYSFLMFVLLIFNYKEMKFKDLSPLYSMTILIPLGLSSIIHTRDLSDKHGMFFAILAVMAAWIPDIGAYFTGTLFGKTKLCPDISPKKTIEGLLGGTVLSVLIMAGVGWVFSALYYQGEVDVNYIPLLLIGFFASFTSVVGDLSFSLIKRNYGAKDFGNLIPGHGGMLDRFDSVIFTAPLVFYVLRNISLIV